MVLFHYSITPSKKRHVKEEAYYYKPHQIEKKIDNPDIFKKRLPLAKPDNFPVYPRIYTTYLTIKKAILLNFFPVSISYRP